MNRSRFQLLSALAGLGLLIFFITRLVLLVVSWSDASPHAGDLLRLFATGFIYDAAFLAYALIPAALYFGLLPQRVWQSRAHGFFLRGVVFCVLYVASFVAVAEYLFWDEFKVRFNFIAIDYLIYRREVTDNIAQSYPLLPLFAGMFMVALLLYRLLRRPLQQTLASRESFRHRATIAGGLLLLPLLVYSSLGQGGREVSTNTYLNELAGNGPYQFVAAFRNNELDYPQFYAVLQDAEAANLLRHELGSDGRFVSNDMFDIRRDVVASHPARRLNVILVTVESLSSDFLGYFGKPNDLTPNLDALVDKSLFFDNFYATGTRTTRGLEAITLSIPPTPGRSIIKRIGRETDQWSLGDVLDSQGYDSYFIYGGRSYFENMGDFFAGNGYQIIDQSSVPDREISFANAWGMADEDLYRQAMQVADREAAEKKPFFMHLMTTSNHRPYTYPDGRVDIPSGSGRDGAVKYTDYAIGEFLRQAEGHSWFDDTVFVIVADHQAGSAGKRALPVERYHIPLWIYAPHQFTPQHVTTLASQIDLAPTLLGLLDVSYRSAFFGQDVFRNPPNRALIANYQYLGLFDGQRLAILEPQKKIRVQEGFADGKVRENTATDVDPLVLRDIGYYQGAAYVYGHHFNAWSLRDAKTLTAPAALVAQTSRRGVVQPN